jgi:L,D-transpeptidase catalytic domain/Putative peptidoglycan binding domain
MLFSREMTVAVVAGAVLALAVGAAAAPSATGASRSSPCLPTEVPVPAPGSQPTGSPLITYPSPAAVPVSQTSATLLGAIDMLGGAGEAAFEYGNSTGYGSCSPPVTLSAQSGAQPVSATIASLAPGVTYHFRLVVASAAGQTLGEDQSFTTSVARLSPGTKILGVGVGHLTPAAALAKVRAAFNRPLRFDYRGKRWRATPQQFGAQADVAAAVEGAFASAASQVPLHVTVDQAKIRRYVTYLAGLLDSPQRSGSVKLVGSRAVVVPSRPAIAVRRASLESAIAGELRSSPRRLLTVPVTQTSPRAPGALAIVIRLGEQSLTLYKDGNVVLKTPVTTGRPALPTPVGSYDVAWRRSPYTFISPWPKGSPYYYPPAHATWAMYFYDNDFMHDDSAEPASAFGPGSNFGPYASHGCVHVPTEVMRTLYSTVPDHTPVIVAAS